MDEVQEFCRRVLGAVPEADEAAAQARSASAEDRVVLLAAAARECRVRAERHEVQADHVAVEAHAQDLGLAGAVAAELASATAALPERQREGLALRELLRLSYEQISQVMDIEQAAVAPLLARARLRLRVERRGTDLPAGTECAEGERALRLLACRQDSEPLSAEDEGWLLAHMSSCLACETRHAAMLEASVCYRAWPRELPRPGVGAELGQ
ncbi:MAG: Sigma-70, region 4 [Solirubrobacteraceae bacterium]|nr:Sigma-70, region 4 [Solirubrobacteraceae bacterium]